MHLSELTSNPLKSSENHFRGKLVKFACWNQRNSAKIPKRNFLKKTSKPSKSEQLATETLGKVNRFTPEPQCTRYLGVCKFIFPLSSWVDLVMFDIISVSEVNKILQLGKESFPNFSSNIKRI